jgi:myosin-5
METIFDVCFLLNTSQIKKILSLYHQADFDSPLSADLLKSVAARSAVSEKSDILLLDLDTAPEFSKPVPRVVKKVEKV